MTAAAMQNDAGARFIRDNFDPEDRLAVVLIDRSSGSVTQRISSARQIASPEFQVWLKSENRSGRDVFVSMNALHQRARGRTRSDVSVVRIFTSISTRMGPRLSSASGRVKTCRNRITWSTRRPAIGRLPGKSKVSVGSKPRK